jgi:essential nuclear protein 1
MHVAHPCASLLPRMCCALVPCSCPPFPGLSPLAYAWLWCVLVRLALFQRDIKEQGKLNFHLYLALKKALYKPSAFFKGVLLPLCEGRCSLREALIISSVLQKVSVPMLHSAVAILKLAEMPFSPANTLFLRTLMLKKYALPYRVVDALVEYFCTYESSDEPPPVLWQQTLLAFVQHYKAEITAEQKEGLKALMRAQPHAQITPEIRRELFSVRSRGDPYAVGDAEGMAMAMAD